MAALSDRQQQDLYNAVMNRIDPNTFNMAQWNDPQQGWQRARDAELFNLHEWLRNDKGEPVIVAAIRKVVKEELAALPAEGP